MMNPNISQQALFYLSNSMISCMMDLIIQISWFSIDSKTRHANR